MEPAGLLSFPVEVLHNISQYLTVKDVLNCSKTCHYLRMAFNDNRVWRKFVPDEALQLEAQEQILKPAFKWKNTLTPLCEYRVHYMRLNYVLNNWTTENFAHYSSKVNQNYVGHYNVPKGRGQVFYKARYLFLGRFINDFESDGIEVWDVAKEPVMRVFLSIENVNYNHFYLTGSNLVVVECRMVLVYQINLPEIDFPLLYSYIITESEAVCNGEDVHSERCDIHCVGWSHYNIGQYLVSNKCGDEGEGSVIHVWDISNAVKVGAFALPVDGYSVSVESYKGDEWLLRRGTKSYTQSLFFLFNVKEKSFTDTGFIIDERLKQAVLYNSHIIAFTYNTNSCSVIVCIVYDLKTKLVVKTRCFSGPLKTSFTPTKTIVNGSFIVICYRSVQKIDALTLATIDTFRCELDGSPITNHFNVYGSTFVVACSGHGWLYIWNVAKKEKLTIPMNGKFNNSLMHRNYNLTKLILLYEFKINVLHFW